MASLTHSDSDFIEPYLSKAKEYLKKYPMTKIITASDYIYETQKEEAYKLIKNF